MGRRTLARYGRVSRRMRVELSEGTAGRLASYADLLEVGVGELVGRILDEYDVEAGGVLVPESFQYRYRQALLRQSRGEGASNAS